MGSRDKKHFAQSAAHKDKCDSQLTKCPRDASHLVVLVIHHGDKNQDQREEHVGYGAEYRESTES